MLIKTRDRYRISSLNFCLLSPQACYGIVKVPVGNWLCRTCVLGINPQCLLCPQKGGAMKATRAGTKWAHVSCALWIPEVNQQGFISSENRCLYMDLVGNFVDNFTWSWICWFFQNNVELIVLSINSNSNSNSNHNFPKGINKWYKV